MKTSEFRRFLASLGATFVEGKKHTKAYLNGKQTTLPRHATEELGLGLRMLILRQLGVKQKGK
ncbi:type II toxin-antitoxin system HicA family toxin [Variovorax ginsengisoli]|uniref:Type II toxin-antitoxin system HicA family toxin n=1 Tax=Variovorax ginsengisoli TaxID=363844 RepID=A0ABT8SE69_9BURK|nr:type II toxin-antitoxin system HicA family toxin [Variovorax ginsengisoli]MDN8617973.1 type II toxin-antitoxin system HicA family toxin [Variovorax ginsengisoli]MDO1537143.1 type II toxin-antitoxin system HicA family toxin [Variovorax ginsengisoli]